MNFRVRCVLCLVHVFLALACAASPKNIFLFIGDGMSVPQRMMADEYSRYLGRGPLAMNALPIQGSSRTRSADSLITDSAAAATAIACGEKTKNYMSGVDPDGRRLESVAEVAKQVGLRVGVVTTVTITHATPAGFYAHRSSRGCTYQIGLDLITSGFDYFAGGGMDGKEDDSKNPEYKGNVFGLARKAGYDVVFDRDGFDRLLPGRKAWGVFSRGTLPFAIDDDGRMPSLSELTRKGIELLRNPAGFFFMVEGGRIDWAGHANDAVTVLTETIAFDDAIKVALAFQEKHPDDTLVLVTGDHETGGMSMGFAGTGYAMHLEKLTNQKRSTQLLAEEFLTSIRANTNATFESYRPFLEKNFGFAFEGKDGSDDKRIHLTEEDKDRLRQTFENDRELATLQQQENTAYDARKYYMFTIECRHILAEHAGIGWTSFSHTALPTMNTARGPGAELFAGHQDNTEIAKALKKLILTKNN